MFLESVKYELITGLDKISESRRKFNAPGRFFEVPNLTPENIGYLTQQWSTDKENTEEGVSAS